MYDPDCPFCHIARGQVVLENPHATAVYDLFPVTPLHMLIIPKRHEADYFELSGEEHASCTELLRLARRHILHRDRTVIGFNMGVNAGEAAGQTIFHCHIHLIPRRQGDSENPKGGVRGVIPSRQHY
ncbi:HIT family protein [Chlorobium sp. N1]|uniref:HIT family protein n=1 Tax=Chlorobium sp. N1 TaxID=2491138 RepID=UPI00104077AB|nr:HIT family protein [Chlorobium sp. N1]TCD47317.1 HIT family protein [Chlorobium sp. N1]